MEKLVGSCEFSEKSEEFSRNFGESNEKTNDVHLSPFELEMSSNNSEG